MMRVVLDANILVSGFTSSNGAPSAVLAAWADLEFEVILSEHILAGAVRGWSKPYFRTRYTGAQVQETLVLLRSDATMVVPANTVHGIAAHTEDDLVLATAISGKADYLVTSDISFRKVGEYQRILLLSPREFLDLLEREHAGNQ